MTTEKTPVRAREVCLCLKISRIRYHSICLPEIVRLRAKFEPGRRRTMIDLLMLPIKVAVGGVLWVILIAACIAACAWAFGLCRLRSHRRRTSWRNAGRNKRK
jgi:hypothetical protein